MKNSTPLKMLVLLCCGFLLLFLSQACLGIVQFIAPDTANADQTISTLVRVKPYNTAESRVKVDYYLSSDNRYDPEDVFLQTAESYIAPNDGYVDVSTNFRLPSNLNSGEYFLLAIAYESENVWVYNQGQNIFSRKINIIGSANNQADLMLADVYVGRNAQYYYQAQVYYPGRNLVTNLSLINRSPGAGTTAVTVRYYLNRSATFSITDPENLLVDEDIIVSMAPDERSEIRSSFEIPSVVNFGVYYLHIIADFWNSTDEINEDNNLATRLFYIAEKREDHYISTVNSPGLVLTGQPFPVTYTEGINNRIGNYATQVGIYLSADEQYSNDDELVFSTSTNSSAISNTYNRTRSVVLPPQIATGSYYLIVRINHQNTIPDADLTNNSKAIRVFAVGTTNLTEEDICNEVANSLQERDEEHQEKLSQLIRQQKESTTALALNVYPNPASDRVNLQANFKKAITTFHLEVVDSKGKVLQSMDARNIPGGKWEENVDIRMLPAGTYYIRAISDQETLTKTLVIM